MSKNKEINVEAILMERIRIIGATISGNDQNELSSDFIIRFDVNQGIDPANNRVKIDLEFDITDEIKSVSGTFSLEFIIQYPLLHNHISGNQENGFSLDSTLSATLIGLAYSTSRGIIYTRCLGTPLQNIILPVIAPLNYLNKQLKSNL